ncbi:MAG: hypothetical protein CFK52_02925 [Chloracidobacterium sp. CP2_5A]|nr:MAG: hypothetical protein CFK52_02925 [Chloracidobacterium sp. CP2_5A]
MGYAMARAALDRGATVTLISGPTRLQPPAGARLVTTRSTREMHDAVMTHLGAATLVVKAAAVCDYRPRQVAREKIKKSAGRACRLELEATEDILAEVGARKAGRFVVGFAAETAWSLEGALDKLRRKRADMLVVNNVLEGGAGFDAETNRVTLVLASGEHRALPLMAKDALAHAIWEVIAQHLPARPRGENAL